MTDDAPSQPLVYWEQPDEGAAPRLPVGRTFGQALDIYGSEPALFLALGIPIAFVSGLVAALPAVLDVATLVALVVVGALIALVSSIATVVATDEVAQGNDPGLGDVLARAIRRSPAVLGAYLLALIAILGVVIVLAVAIVVSAAVLPPAIQGVIALLVFVIAAWAAIRFLPIGQVIVLERVGGLRSFARAWALTRGSAWRILGLLVLVLVMTIPASIGAQLITLVSADPVLRGLATMLATLTTAPLVAIASTVAWARLAERPYGDARVPRPGAARTIALALVLGLGFLLAGIGISQGSSTGFAGLAPRPGVLQAGTARNEFNPCLPTDVKATFSQTDEIYVGGYFPAIIPAGESLAFEMYHDGQLLWRDEVDTGTSDTGCFYEEMSLRGYPSGAYRVVIRRDGGTVAEGEFVIEP